MLDLNWQRLTKNKIVILDGATGTELIKRGMPGGVCPEQWVLEHSEAIQAVQHAYEEAGSNIVYTPTFGGNRVKLSEFGLEKQVIELNRTLAQISRAGVKNARIFGDMAPTGRFVEPFGDFLFEEAVAVYKEQAQGLLEGGVDGFAIETMMDLQEARAALIAVRELSDLPVIVSMTFGEGGRTLTGNTPAAAIVALQALGATAVGCNCSAGPEQMLQVVAEMKSVARVPIVAKPNAGMPRFDQGRTVYDMTPEEFGEKASRLVAAGASIVGGCCGTSPEHIHCLAQAVAQCPLPEMENRGACVSSASRVVRIQQNEPFGVIGERLNPTGKKTLQAELRAGRFELVRKMAQEQKESGATMLDVNCGLSGIDEAATLRKMVAILAVESDLPLCIDTTDPEAAEAALRLYPGRALFNSISAESSRLKKVLPVVAKYGAELILLPLDDSGIPETVQARTHRIEQIYREAQQWGYSKQDMMVDGLVMTVSANPEAACVTLDTIEWASRVWQSCTVCGLSNISFGLPRRDLVNLAFLNAAISRGLNFAIANPMSVGIMDAVRASDVLFGRDAQAAAFIAAYAGKESPKGAPAAPVKELTLEERAFKAVLEGEDEALLQVLDALLASGKSASAIVNEQLIPAITEVGNRYEKQEFFLPQLMAGARAMKTGMERLAPLLGQAGMDKPSCGKVILATVRGDIHDIGKNIVLLMLKNYGFEVIDLGKDVPAERIIQTAVEQRVTIIGLSALMTTTMGAMKEVVEMAKDKGLGGTLHFIVGGAVVDEEFANSIGASYAKDAMAVVRLAQQFATL